MLGASAGNFLHFVGVLVPEKELKDMDQDIIYSPWGGSKGPWLSFIDKHLFFFFLLLDLFLLFLCFIISQIKFALQNLRWPWKLIFFYKKEVGGNGGSVPKFLEDHAQCQVPLIAQTPNMTYKVHELRPWKFFLQWLPFHSSGFIHLCLNHINKNILMNYGSVNCSVVPNSLWPHGL